MTSIATMRGLEVEMNDVHFQVLVNGDTVDEAQITQRAKHRSSYPDSEPIQCVFEKNVNPAFRA